ncbi:hypothetical protein AXG93_1660s1470 [Marchantia polymorpha subsp. ruderalis]|uniref:Uncharacterized protein n=1 Tax=Marchantia polymorpha subsp. ruderalis TaxID=1480154 RepID=A0A176VR69_MARPO|nr:hypothetical protein AXG93_1660s1470 [Marchantia polymorpha subsp. ruderalis]
MLAGSGAVVAAEEAARSSSKESPRISVATKILDTEYYTGLEYEVESVQGTLTGVLCNDESRADRPGPEVPGAGGEEQCPAGTCYTLLRLHKTALQLRDDAAAEAQRKFEKQRAKIEAELHSKRAQNCSLAEELVRQTRLVEQSDIARKADEELLRRLQSQCDKLRAHRAEAELQLVEFEGDNRRATDCTREELVARVNRCVRGYTRWEIAARERVTLRELEICAAALTSDDSWSRRRVAKRLDSFLSRSRDAIANLEAEVTAVLRRLGLRNRAEDWSGRELVRSRPSHRRHSR